MKKVILLFMAVAFMAGCGKVVKTADPQEVAGAAAKQYYEYLKEGNYEAFVDGTYRERTLRPNFREELMDNAKMLKGRIDKKHGGISDIDVKESIADTIQSVANVYLDLNYGDGNKETVLVPMVEKEDLWYMR